MNQFNQLVESLKRLYYYENNKVDINKLKQLVSDKKITEIELNYILRKEENDVHDTN